MRGRASFFAWPVLLAAFFLGLSTVDSAEVPNEKTIRLLVSVPPQAEMVKRIAGDRANVELLVPQGRDPHTFEPTPQQIRALAGADLYLAVGMPFEKGLLERIQSVNPRLKVVDTSEGVRRRRIEEGHDHVHEHDASCRHGELDPHIWMAPAPVKVQARNIARALSQFDPQGAEGYRQGLNRFLQSLDQVDQKLRAKLAPYRGRTVLVYHPAIGYFCDAYGLKQKAVETGGRSPSPRQLRQLIKQARAERVEVLFVMPQFDTKATATVAESIDGTVVPIDPLSSDLLENWQRIADVLVETWKK